ncbi:bifunctional phosphopantothenoylcysteine decarboxylase/phosphopantothenate--cysteine ligase CoaBC [Clostridium sp. D2Q-14]|uniref:bifunctional phosphopantothenoylcysteine decarboxylase/phosphopantothenate--cysteine ligase CoaBC n=1 Tax=Anaeromonas gelatinilytica TaxID=2683194 RepID=UPI00193B5D93|nr:bifunctional phosphopantothenoylcysteine decarboxylase/phosphopantothenate--cysteine ligase CoaBC [Anaeromonas gelatinilytica]MBS4536114.1 bifunctional phosphopantothenoylcysteine decarboxylase/phosphopantothenate--cysteine ligase CoaBC [Anaeromonas gelatinilytica]
MLKNKNIVLGVTGGIAVYKAVDVVSRLKKLNANIDVIMTDSASKFVTPLTFQSMSQNHVTVDMFKEPVNWDIEHISLAKKADIFLIVPATANVIGKVANGIADDMLTTTIMATKAKVIFAPAMNTQMYLNPIFKNNMKVLQELDYEFISPEEGRLACGDIGPGKLADPEYIVKYVIDHFNKKKDLEGKKVLITAGPTIEAFDPVRYISNHSSGKMGYSIAEEAKNRGANVTLISGPTKLLKPVGINIINVTSTEEMYEETIKYFKSTDILIKAAAPSDYKPISYNKNKIKKSEGSMHIELTRNPDILEKCGEIKDSQIIIGFAAETENIEEYAINKMENKNLDMIVANNIAEEGAGFKGDTNKVIIFNNSGKKKEYPLMSKKNLAKIILDNIK